MPNLLDLDKSKRRNCNGTASLTLHSSTILTCDHQPSLPGVTKHWPSQGNLPLTVPVTALPTLTSWPTTINHFGDYLVNSPQAAGDYRSSYPVTLLSKLKLVMRRITELVCSIIASSWSSTTRSPCGQWSRQTSPRGGPPRYCGANPLSFQNDQWWDGPHHEKTLRLFVVMM